MDSEINVKPAGKFYKQAGFVLLFLGLLLLLLTFTLVNTREILLFLGGSTSGFAFVLLGFSSLSIQSGNRQLKTIFLTLAIAIFVLCIIFKKSSWPGGNIMGVVSIFIYCFVYAPLELFYKYQKWKQYATHAWEIMLLSSLDFVGINFILLGILTRYLHWPGQYYLIYPGVVLLVLGLIMWNYRFKKEVINRKLSEDKIKKQYIEIEKEKQISENLLLNILPEEVAEELKQKGSADAKQFDDVTVLFTDFKDFTKLSERMSARELVEEIHTCFMAFDGIMEKFGIEKIKTIGDSYMCAGGLPVANQTHPVDVVNAGLEIQKFIAKRMDERIAQNKEPFNIRIGIHTGPVVAGIVGVKKFAYDIWGDTVNTASRMESSGEAGKVNISQSTYQLVKDHFVCTPRGMVMAKGKGEMEMYFVEKGIAYRE